MASPAPAPTLPPPPPLPENDTNPPPLSSPIGSPPPVSIPSPSLPSTSVLPPLLPPSVDMMPPVDIVNPPFTGSETLNSPINSLSPLEATSPSPVSLVSPVTLPEPPIPSFSLPSPPPPLTKILIPPITSPPPPPLTELPYPSPSLNAPSVSLSSPPPPPITQVNARGISVQALNRFNLSTGLIAGISVSGVLLLVLLGVCCFCCMKRRKKKDNYYASLAQLKQKKCGLKRDHVINVPPKPLSYPPLLNSNGGSYSNDSGFENPLSPQGPGIALGYSSCIFTYEDLVVATNGFSEANLLGQGGFGYVHKGILSDGREIAVKKLKPGSSQGEREFQAEVETISRVHHKHLVSLVGYCCAGVERLLVYEFVPNNTLEFHLHGTEQTVMKWATRLKIAIGSAKGLAYLHEYCNPTVIHRDIKSSNILIDNQFEAKVSDFGLAKFFSDTSHLITHISTRVVGTFGYLDPEYANCGKVTDKSDVFSYGVVLLELITGRVPINTTQSCTHQSLFEWARPLLKQALEDQNFDALVDPRLQKSYEMNEMASMVACAAACVRQSAWLRPRMSQIVRVLEGDISFSILNEGTRPGESAICGPIIDLKNLEDMNKWSTRDFGTSDSCEKASDHGLNPSCSSTDDTHKIPVRQDKKDI